LARIVAATCFAALSLAYSSSAQQPAQPDTTQQQAAPAPPQATAPQAQFAPPQVELAPTQEAGGITEAELKQLLVGKPLYLRGGYLDNSLSFDEHGRLIGHSPQGSFTLNGIQIDHMHLTKHKVTLEGARYGLHFTAQLAYEDPSNAFNLVKITPKKKVVKITIDREIVVKPKKEKEPKASKEKNGKLLHATPTAPPDAKQAQVAPPQAAPEPEEMSEADQLKASIAATPEAERPADAKSVTTTTSPEHAMRVLRNALEQIFAQGLDAQMMASLPDFWKLYYQAVAAKTDYRPKDPAVLHQNMVDQKARLLTQFEPDSNEFAQAAGVAGMAQYHVVIEPDGKVGEVAISRPIGFGLDENAVAAIKAAKFAPAIKDGKPVAVMLDLNVPFRIFSKLTNVQAPPEPADKPAEPVLPGPYSVPRP
jgi:TonB family protein